MYVDFLMYNILENGFKCQRALFVLCPDVLLSVWLSGRKRIPFLTVRLQRASYDVN